MQLLRFRQREKVRLGGRRVACRGSAAAPFGLYIKLICTLRHMMMPPGTSSKPLPNYNANGPLANLLSCTSAACTLFISTIMRLPLAVITKVCHWLPASGIGCVSLATSTIAPVP